MKVIVSPSKTMQFDNCVNGVRPLFIDKTKVILNKLKSYSVEELGALYKIKGELLETTYNNIHNFDYLPENVAIKAYTGMVFKGLDLDNYDSDEWDYLNKNILIISAFYGLLTPTTLIKPYRLDFNCMRELYKVWDDLSELIEEPIINLASNEFSKVIKKGMINISFLEYKDGKFKTVATYSKQARGIMLNYIIKNKIYDVEKIKLFNLNNYRYNEELSDKNNFIFTR